VVALDPVERAIAEPLAQNAVGEPLAPAEAEHLAQVAAVHRKDDEAERERGELHQQVREFVDVLRLQRVVELRVPLVQFDVDPDHAEVDRDDRDQQPPRDLPFGRHPVGLDEAPRGYRALVLRRGVGADGIDRLGHVLPGEWPARGPGGPDARAIRDAGDEVPTDSGRRDGRPRALNGT
jgi:hypothetical protein